MLRGRQSEPGNFGRYVVVNLAGWLAVSAVPRGHHCPIARNVVARINNDVGPGVLARWRGG
ncbi:hypothetical protein [Thalassoglobus polymorphus]|uniref:hypothetical protein n=1 Tax=Thalassoglobus polymorphus TaxID=2527994 RepID=UPI0011A4AD3B|nr:hypothetical protein [Thalassoglobus polymorphus]